MKILFISPRPFGLMGTPGTYLLTEAYSKLCDVWVICCLPGSGRTPLVYADEGRICLHTLNFNKSGFLRKVTAITGQMNPDLIIIGNYARWYDLLAELKTAFSSVCFVLDIKSPLIVDGSQKKYRAIQQKGQHHSPLLDLVMTRCREDVDTWIPGCTAPVLEYPLGVRLADYQPRQLNSKHIHCKRFVYVGAIHPRRKLHQMIHYIHQLPAEIQRSVTFDFYGSGPGLEDLKQLTESLGLTSLVSFKGAVDALTLARILPEYDAGVAWVPHEVYGHAPSLKLMEYLAAGLVPLAMDTPAHKRYERKGFHIHFFTTGPASFDQAITRLLENGVPANERTQNLVQIRAYDWDRIVSRDILPVFSELLKPVSFPSQPVASNIYERTLFWDLPLPPEAPEPVWTPKLRIAGIAGDRLFRGLELDSIFLPLTPVNWEPVLCHGRPDFILVESVWISATGHWYLGQTVPGEENDLILRMVETAAKKAIPTVFWMTLDVRYCPQFVTTARRFDRIFCADPLATEWFEKQGMAADTLLPAVQPVLFNPVQRIPQDQMMPAGVIFDGWVELFRNPQLGEVLKRISRRHLKIIQTNQMMYKNQVGRTDQRLSPCIKGTVLSSQYPNLLKHARRYLVFQNICKTKTAQHWDILEATASRVPVAYLGSLDTNDPLRPFVLSFDSEDDFCGFVNKNGTFDIETEVHQQTVWRRTMSDHVFAKRIQTICGRLGISYDWEEFPQVSLVTGTRREHLLSKSMAQFFGQTYPEKELVLIFNGEAAAVENLRKTHARDKQIQIDVLPGDTGVGTVLNLGIHKARGQYFFRMDDDDIYGSNYVLDTMLYLRCVNAEVFGKKACFFFFEDTSELYLRNRAVPAIKTFPARMLQKNQAHLISGCGFAGSVRFLKKYRFPDLIHASVDSALVELISEQKPDARCLLTDSLNLVVSRQPDTSGHTWRIAPDIITKRGQFIGNRPEKLLC
jgi:glycosyltransferase involved in cell wall biosynthesis